MSLYYMVLCLYISLHVYLLIRLFELPCDSLCNFSPQRIWFKGEVGGISLFNFAENCEVGGFAMW